MERNIVKALFLILLTGVSFAAPASALTVTLDGLTTVTEGSSFTIEVWADSEGLDLGLLAFGFNISSDDDSFVEYTTYNIESGFEDDNEFLTLLGLDDTGLDIAGSVLEGIEYDDVLLATISFTAIAEGTATISILGLYDGGFSGLYYETLDGATNGYDINAEITVEVVAGTQPIPEPATLLLLGAGLVGIGGVKKYKKSLLSKIN